MQTFDYAKAWREAANPLALNLPQTVRALFERVRVECADIHQDNALNIVPPDSLREAFEAIDSEALARAARIIHDWGHWKPGSESTPAADGSTWKFSNIADQVLAKRLGLRGRGGRTSYGFSLHVLGGVLRAGYMEPETRRGGGGRHWEEVALATEANLAAIRNEATSPSDWAGRERTWKALRAAHLLADPDPLFAALVDSSRWMFESVNCGGCYGNVPAEGARSTLSRTGRSTTTATPCRTSSPPPGKR